MELTTSENRVIISIKEMREAIKRSGYLLEQRVVPIFEEHGFFVQTNPIYPDPDSEKSREIDLDAINVKKIYREGYHFIFPYIICECENNPQPAVFYVRESPIPFLHCEQAKFSGFPSRIWVRNEYLELNEFLGMEDFHHYCTELVSTQYCTFQRKKDKKEWMALHGEDQHKTFDSLIKYVEYQMQEHYGLWDDLDKLNQIDEPEQQDMNVQIYYPLLVFQGDLYSAYLKNKRLYLKKSNHIQFRKEYFIREENKSETYQIDVITESYLERYLDMIEEEVEKIKRVFQRKRKLVFGSMDKIITDIKNLETRPDNFLTALEKIFA